MLTISALRGILLGATAFALVGVFSGDEKKPGTAAPLPADHAERMKKGLDIFQTEVRQILNDNCVKCHGGKKTEGGLDITSREGLLKGADSGPAVVLWKGTDSLLYKRITTKDTEDRMPQKAEPLSAKAIAALSSWIDYGAPYDKPLIDKTGKPHPHPEVTDDDRKLWSFTAVKPVPPPPVKDKAWAHNPIDQFILAKLEEKKIKPNVAADRRTLMRRAYFDVIGLPPTPEEMDAFLADPAPNAFEKVVDRLLANPHFGERWGRYWLDIARFAESHGFEQDYDRPNAYWYRDFVIKAFNDDMPFNQFVKWNLAGDEFAPNNSWAMAATGFLGACVFPTQLTEAEFESSRYEEMDDMSKTTGVAFLGLTIGCARCHDHKFDPIPNKDYFRILSSFTTTIRSEVNLDFGSDDFQKQKPQWDLAHKSLVAGLEKFEKEQLPARFEQWLKAPRKEALTPPRWILLDLVATKSAGGATLTKQPDGSILASGTNPDVDTYTFTAHTSLKKLTGIRVEALAHPSLVKGGPGRADNGNIDLTDFRVAAAPLGAKTEAVELKLTNAKATFNQGKSLSIELAIDGDKKTGWAVDPQFGKDHAASFEFETPLAGYEGGTKLIVTLDFQGSNRHNIGRPRLAISTEEPPLRPKGDSLPQTTIEAFALAAANSGAKLTDVQRQELMAWYRGVDPEWQKLNAAVQEHAQHEPKPDLKKVLVTSEGLPPEKHHADDRGFPHFYKQTYFLKRGDVKQKGDVATQGFLQILERPPHDDKLGENRWLETPPAGIRTSYRRRSLANWMTDPQYGAGDLLARVIVNRLWHHHLGRGIVSTPNDFGAQGDKPTHPELIDWLANDLKQNNWSLKRIHKLILMSATYQQSNAVDDARAKVDKENRLLWHWQPRRLEGEIIRDSMLAVSGKLDEKMYGPGTLDEGMKRRSIYFFIKRSQLIPFLQLFDAPEFTVSIGTRVNTTIAPQALALLNSPHVRGYAQALAARIKPATEKSLADGVIQGYRLAVGRKPIPSEQDDAVTFLQAQIKAYTADNKKNAQDLALADFCQTLLSLNEFIYVE